MNMSAKGDLRLAGEQGVISSPPTRLVGFIAGILMGNDALLL